MGADPGLDWAQRFDLLCLTFVRSASVVDVLTRFGGDPRLLTPRDAAQAWRAYSWENGFLPVVRAESSDEWTVTVETASAEGARPEVLRRASAGTRTLSLYRDGKGTVGLGYAEDGVVVATGECGTPRAWHGADPRRLVNVATSVGADVYATGLAGALRLAAALTGVPVTGELVMSAALPSTTVLPVLPDLPRVGDSEPERLWPLITERVRRLALDAGLGAYPELVVALAAPPPTGGLDDESAHGRLLRTLVARSQAVAEARRRPALWRRLHDELPPAVPDAVLAAVHAVLAGSVTAAVDALHRAGVDLRDPSTAPMGPDAGSPDAGAARRGVVMAPPAAPDGPATPVPGGEPGATHPGGWLPASGSAEAEGER